LDVVVLIVLIVCDCKWVDVDTQRFQDVEFAARAVVVKQVRNQTHRTRAWLRPSLVSVCVRACFCVRSRVRAFASARVRARSLRTRLRRVVVVVFTR
jgi:hypothetical protein